MWQTIQMLCLLGRDITLLKVYITYVFKQGCTNRIHQVNRVTKSKFRTVTPSIFDPSG